MTSTLAIDTQTSGSGFSASLLSSMQGISIEGG
jgi:hypothetical protein